MEEKTINFYSKPLMSQNIKSNYILVIVVTFFMCLTCVVSTFATSRMEKVIQAREIEDQQTELFSYLYVMASFNDVAGTNLSYDDFISAEDKTTYQQAFDSANQESEDMSLSVEGLENVAAKMDGAIAPIESYVREFEYVYGLGQIKGCFSGDMLDMEDMMNTMFTTMGIEPEKIETMQNMDTTAMFNQMDYTIMGLLPIFLFIVIVGNSLIVEQVDKGSLAYVLSTPTKRSAVTNTQTIFLVVVPFLMIGVTCIARVVSSLILLENVEITQTIMLYFGMYILVEAITGICYLGSCLFDRSKKAMAFGGGLTVWFFMATLLGMFGTKDMVSMGFGAKALDVFNKLTLVGLYDVKSISTIGISNVDYTFVWKLAILLVIAVICYAAGSYKFKKKDLPL